MYEQEETFMEDDIHQQNKVAWEEAFDKRSENWLDDRMQRLSTEPFPYLEPEFVALFDGMDFAGKDIAQFSCNDGRELLSICRSAGARSGVGFDIAENMVAYANECARNLALPCRFVATDILAIGPEFHEAFDFVFITIGALSWFEDLTPYFERVASCLRPGGRVFVHEMHPATTLFGAPGESGYDEAQPTKVVNPYFRKEPWVETNGMGYLTGGTYASKPFTSFAFTLEDLFAALIGNGLRIEAFKEFDNDISEMFPLLDRKGLPLSMAVVGRKVARP
jgi:SAM-dependent methyltransferase